MTPERANIEAMSWWGYVEQVSKRAPRVQIAKLVGLTPSAVSRWATGALPDPDKAAALARAYDRPVLEAFLAAGWLTAEEAGQHPAERPDLGKLTDDELIDEVARRMKGAAAHGKRGKKMSSGAGGTTADAGPAPMPRRRRGRTAAPPDPEAVNDTPDPAVGEVPSRASGPKS